MHGGMNTGQEAETGPKAPVPECAGFRVCVYGKMEHLSVNA